MNPENYPNLSSLVEMLDVGNRPVNDAITYCMQFCSYPRPAAHELMEDVCFEFDEWLTQPYAREHIMGPLERRYLRGELDWQRRPKRTYKQTVNMERTMGDKLKRFWQKYYGPIIIGSLIILTVIIYLTPANAHADGFESAMKPTPQQPRFAAHMGLSYGAPGLESEDLITQMIGFEIDAKLCNPYVRYERIGGPGYDKNNFVAVGCNAIFREGKRWAPYIGWGVAYFDELITDPNDRKGRPLNTEHLQYDIVVAVRYRNVIDAGIAHNSTAGRSDRNRSPDRLFFQYTWWF